MSKKEQGRKWDGKSRIPDDTYRKNWNDIFGKKQYNDFDPHWSKSYKEELDPETQEYVNSLKEKL